MAGIIDKTQIRLTAPRIRQPVRRHRRADHIMPPLDDMGRQMPDHRNICHDMVRRHETVIDEIMHFQPCHAQRRPSGDTPHAGPQGRAACLVGGPSLGCRLMNKRLVACQLVMIAEQDIIPFLLGQEADEILIGLGEEAAHIMKEPVNLGARTKKDAAQHQAGDTLRVGDGIGKSKRTAPGATKQQPLIDAKPDPERLDIGYQVLGCILRHLPMRC